MKNKYMNISILSIILHIHSPFAKIKYHEII
uniref:Uncharacterized protein n=1 Tax=viral metagenome TaxID=1070528 RepID=A0A6C0LSM4_9ZZZZ